MQKVLQKKYNLKATDCPNANYIMDNGFYIPCGNTITNDEIDFVSEKIIKLGKKINLYRQSRLLKKDIMFELDEPYVEKEELNYLKQAIESGWISAMGPFVKKFEEEFAKYIGVKYVVSCASGTSATSLLCPTLQIKPGDEVILQSLTFTADAWAMHQAGAKIIFTDCAKDTFSIDPEDVRKKYQKKTKIISPTHLYGRASKMDALREICDENNIYLIEDCCQAMGSKYKNKMVGSIGDLNFYSFHNKLIASGEGGMITTNDKNLADRF